MATADEILATMEDDPTGYNAVCVVDFASRKITVPPALSVLGVESDDDVRRINFVMPSTYGEYDLSDFEININYLNAGGEGDIYTVDDQAVVDDTITFTWLVGRTAFMYKGDVKFIVCLKLRGDTGAVVKELNTTVATTEVLEGLEVADSVVEHNPDVIEAILVRLNHSEGLSLSLTGGSAKGSVRLIDSKAEDENYMIGEYAFALGRSSRASGDMAFAIGDGTEAAGTHSYAEGSNSRALGVDSHAEGLGTIATKMRSHVQGSYNIEDTAQRYLHILGNGTSSSKRSNAHTIDENGNAWFAGDVFVGNASQDEGKKLVTMRDILSEVICIVNMTAEADDTMSAFTFLSKDKSFADVKRVFDNGGYVACRIRWTAGAAAGMIMEGHLVSYAEDGNESAFVFAFGANPLVMFNSDDTVIIAND